MLFISSTTAKFYQNPFNNFYVKEQQTYVQTFTFIISVGLKT